MDFAEDAARGRRRRGCRATGRGWRLPGRPARLGDDADDPRRVECGHLRGQEVVGDEDAGGVGADCHRHADQVSVHVVADGANVVGPGPAGRDRQAPRTSPPAATARRHACWAVTVSWSIVLIARPTATRRRRGAAGAP